MGISNELFFNLLSYTPGPFWLMILFLPNNRKAMLGVDVYLIIMSCLFVIQTIPELNYILSIILQPTYVEMKNFIGSEAGFLGTWNHMILSDLWIGRWVAHDSLQFNKSLLIRLLIIPVIMVLGPFGLFFYLLFRIIKTRSIGFYSIPEKAKNY